MKPQRLTATCGNCAQPIPGFRIVTNEKQAREFILQQLNNHTCPIPPHPQLDPLGNYVGPRTGAE